MSEKRKKAVHDGRAMIRARYISSREPTTIAVCPGCWNMEERRKVLLIKLKKMGLEVVHKNDTLGGVYNRDRQHASGCPYGKIDPDPWGRFRKAMGKDGL